MTAMTETCCPPAASTVPASGAPVERFAPPTASVSVSGAGVPVGETEGDTVEEIVGEAVGETVGDVVGDAIGDVVGAPVGEVVGDVDGAARFQVKQSPGRPVPAQQVMGP